MGELLLIDDDPGHLRLLTRWLERGGHHVRAATTGVAGRALLSAHPTDAVLLDLHLEDEDGVEVLQALKLTEPDVPVLMLTGERGVDHVVRAMKAGALDYLAKPITRTALQERVDATLREPKPVAVAEKHTVSPGHHGLIGESPAMRALSAELQRVGGSDITVLVAGESGTGKELVARALHQLSGRREGPFVALNCAAIPETLQEAELFGHEKGAFTGADTRRPGRFEQADGGTLFLDEVAELTPSLQAKLLRVLQERRFHRVGGGKEVATDVRIIAASHRSLAELVSGGRFREDLYYRLAVYELEVPSLRERPGDVELLAAHFLERCNARDGRSLTWSPRALQALRAHTWPGNVRELQNAVERAAVATPGPTIGPEHLPRRLATKAPTADEGALKPMEAMEKAAILRAIEEANGNMSEVIRRLDIPRTTLYRRLKKYGIRT